MKLKDDQERRQRQVVLQNPMRREQEREKEVRSMLERTEARLLMSQDIFQKNLADKVSHAKTVNEKLDQAAKRAKEHQQKEELKKQRMFDAEWRKFNEKMVIRQEILEDKQLSTKEANLAEFERHKKQASMVKERDFQAVLQRINER